MIADFENIFFCGPAPAARTHTSHAPKNSSPAGLANGPLSGIRVVECGVFHAGPGAGAILGDLGAEVIKIETGRGDPERFWSVIGGVDITVPGGESIMFEISNRNKKGLHLDMQTENDLKELLDEGVIR